MKFVIIKAPATEYRLMCFKFGGDKFFEGKGFSKYDYVAGILLGPNSSLLIGDTWADAEYVVEMAGHTNAKDIAAAWEYIARNFEKLPVYSVLEIEPNADDKYQWIVSKVTAWEVI